MSECDWSATEVRASTPGGSRERRPMLGGKSPKSYEVGGFATEFNLGTDRRYGGWD